jgi:hypothetical protein
MGVEAVLFSKQFRMVKFGEGAQTATSALRSPVAFVGYRDPPASRALEPGDHRIKGRDHNDVPSS